MSLNITLLEEVKRRILAEPKQFVMHSYFTDNIETELPEDIRLGFNDELMKLLPTKFEIPNCGTAACIAGHIYSIVKQKNPEDSSNEIHAVMNFEEWAANQLGVPYWWARKIFHVANWDYELATLFESAPIGSLERAQIAVKQIDQWIAKLPADI